MSAAKRPRKKKHSYITKWKKLAKGKQQIAVAAILGIITLAVLLALAAFNHTGERRIITTSSLQKIVSVDELSTFSAVYNGIAEVKNEKNPENTDYFVSYEATVKTGISFDLIKISIDHEQHRITIQLPDVKITDVDVDFASMDFIFYNNKANTSTVSQQAYKACEADVFAEISTAAAIYDSAALNAENVLRALVTPLLSQMDTDYELIFEREEAAS